MQALAVAASKPCTTAARTSWRCPVPKQTSMASIR